MSRLAKQFIYGLFYLAVLGCMGAIVYFGFVRPAPGCLNGRQDSGEEGIDCGGACANVCIPPDIREIEIPEPVWLFKSQGTTLEILAKVQNPNIDFSARTFDYRFDLFDANDTKVTSLPGSSYIYAGEIKYLTAIESLPSVQAIVRAEIVITNPSWGKKDTFSRPVVIDPENVSKASTNGMLTISGRVTNRDTVTLDRADIVAVFMGSYGSPVGISRTELDTLSPNDQRQFSILHPAISGAVIDKTQIYVYGLRP